MIKKQDFLNKLLLLAAEGNITQIIILALLLGADKNTKNHYGNTVITLAEHHNNKKIIRFLKNDSLESKKKTV